MSSITYVSDRTSSTDYFRHDLHRSDPPSAEQGAGSAGRPIIAMISMFVALKVGGEAMPEEAEGEAEAAEEEEEEEDEEYEP